MLAGSSAACVYLWRKFGALMPPLSAVRIAICAAAIYGASALFLASSKVLIIGKLVTLSVSYLVALIISREVGRDDLRMITRVVHAK